MNRRAMTRIEKYAAHNLAGCTFQIGSYNKRFARDMSGMAGINSPVTEKQVNNLWRLVFRYRRQITDKRLISFAERRIRIQKINEEIQLKPKIASVRTQYSDQLNKVINQLEFIY